jgi:hypothetical protein
VLVHSAAILHYLPPVARRATTVISIEGTNFGRLEDQRWWSPEERVVEVTAAGQTCGSTERLIRKGMDAVQCTLVGSAIPVGFQNVTITIAVRARGRDGGWGE